MAQVKLRGHHLVCLQFFKGEGYSKEFIDNLHGVMKRLKTEVALEVVEGRDDVCLKCPHLKGEICSYAEKEIRAMDNKAHELLKFYPGELVEWDEVSKKVEKIRELWRKEFCDGCDWENTCWA
ncbi:MAG: DUF1284 domain-containing protein [Euryarchaeota archaeon]|nr:DUF1284 domain-containing protein [Euryarchaeota archaeon]